MKTYLLINIGLGLFLSSCSDIFSDSDVKGVDAKIVFAGSEASDGCGWIVVVSEEEKYKPESLPEEFKIDKLAVNVSFKELDSTYSCGFPSVNSPQYPNIRITKIKKD